MLGVGFKPLEGRGGIVTRMMIQWSWRRLRASCVESNDGTVDLLCGGLRLIVYSTICKPKPDFQHLEEIFSSQTDSICSTAITA
jgi:hypothetical protein